jgi:hypothetical protein
MEREPHRELWEKIMIDDREGELEAVPERRIVHGAGASITENGRSGSNEKFDTVPFSKTWTLEGGVRSRFSEGLFGSLRMHCGKTGRGLYGAVVYPSFNVQFRL